MTQEILKKIVLKFSRLQQLPVVEKLLKNVPLKGNEKFYNNTLTNLMTKEQHIKYAVFAAEQVLDIFEKKYPKDNRPRKAIEAAKVYLENTTQENKNAAAYAANAAANAAYEAAYEAANEAAYEAAYAANAAAYAANAAAYAANAAANATYEAAYEAAYEVAYEAAYAANAAAYAEVLAKIVRYGLELLDLEIEKLLEKGADVHTEEESPLEMATTKLSNCY